MFLFTTKQFELAFLKALEMMQENEGLEPTSALKQAATDYGIEEGEQLAAFVYLSNKKLFGEEA